MATAAVLLLALAFFSWLMFRITAQYVPVHTDVAFLRIKQQYLPVTHWLIAFFVHVFTSMFALLAGFTQFSRAIRKRVPAIHRWMGRLYVLDVVLVTGPASFVMAIYANGGLPSKLAFGILAVGWIATTFLAYQTIRRGDVVRHREWIIRSYALTLSAITLRIWKYLLVAAFHPPPLDVYRLAAWLGWVPNIIVAELIIRATSNRVSAISSPRRASPSPQLPAPRTAPDRS